MNELEFIVSYVKTGDVAPTDVTLLHAPDGWLDNFIEINRGFDYMQLFTSFTLKLKFVKEGATLLRQIFLDSSFQGNYANCNATLTINKLDKINLTYSTIKILRFDFVTFVDNFIYVEIELCSFGLTDAILKNIDKIYEVDFSSNIASQPYWIYTGYTPTPPFPDKFCTYFSPDQLIDSLINAIATDYGLTTSVASDITSGLFTLGPGGLGKQHIVEFTTGRNIRLDDKLFVKTSLRNILNFLNTIKNISCGVETIAGIETFIIREFGYAFDSTNTLEDVGIVKDDFTFSPIQELMINEIVIGYPETSTKYSNDENYTKEFNSQSTFTNTNKVKKSLEFLSDVNCAYSVMDQIKNNLGDESNDDKLFCVVIEIFTTTPPNPSLRILNYGGLSKNSTGVPSISVYNLSVSPRRCLVRKLKYFNSIFYKLFTQITFKSSNLENDINNLEDVEDVAYVGEWEPLTLDFNDVYFLPFYFNFSAQLSDNFYYNWLTNPMGMIKFTYLNETYYGFVVNVKPNFIMKSETKIKLIAAPEGVGLNDLTKLIR